MIINGDGGYDLLAAYIGGPAAQVGWLGLKVDGHLAPFLYSSREPNELSQWLCDYDSTIKYRRGYCYCYYCYYFFFTLGSKDPEG